MTQTDQIVLVAKKCQTEASTSKSRPRDERMDSVSPVSYTSRSASTLSSSAALRNLNHTQNILLPERDRTKNPAFVQLHTNEALYPSYKKESIPVQSPSEKEKQAPLSSPLL